MFRPCIDLHDGRVKQIVGGTLDSRELRTNFVSEKPAEWFAELYRRDGLRGGHVILLGPGNESAAKSALAAYPKGLQIGGGINLENAARWLEAGASQVIVTSWIFREGKIEWERLEQLAQKIGREQLVIDLSCRKRDGRYFVVTDRWQKFTDTELGTEIFGKLEVFCSEFLVHAVDVEGLCQGIDQELVKQLTSWSRLPATYAGGAKSLGDLEDVTRLSQNRVDLTIGSALDIFGGTQVRYTDCVEFNKRVGG